VANQTVIMQKAPTPTNLTADTGSQISRKQSIQKNRKRFQTGFTLVEVVLAIGIIAFAFVPLVALLPIGLGVSRQAIDTTVQAQIAQQLITEAQQTDFSLLTNLQNDSVNKPYYFDDQGNKSSASATPIYKAIIGVQTSTVLPSSPVPTNKLATVTICILSLTANQTSRETDLTKNPDAKKYTVLIPDNGR